MTVKEKLIKIESLADKMYNAAFNMTTDASLLRKAMDDYHQFIIKEYHKEEPVSKDLEEAAEEYTSTGYEFFDSMGHPHVAPAFKAGAKWQLSKLPKWKKAINRSCWSGEIRVNPTLRRFEYEHYVIDADKLFEALEKEE